MMRRHTSPDFVAAPGHSRRGSLMIMVLLVALGLVTVTLYFADTMTLEYRGAENSMAGFEAAQAGEGARRYIVSMLTNLQTKGQMPELALDYQGEQVLVGDTAQFWLLGRDPNVTTNLDRPTFGLVDEASKININTAPVEVLELLPGMTAELAAEIVDWRDEDDEATANGAESDIYAMRNPPYLAKNGRFESVDELRLLAGMTYQILYGEDANRNGILDPNENDGSKTPPYDNQDGKLDPGIIDYVTAWSREPNTQADGTARVNVRSTTSTQELQTALNNALGEERGRTVLQAVGDRTQLRSLLEFYVKSGMTADEWAKVQDALTASNGEFVEGLINAATAPAAVLACIPGVLQDGADKIVSYRQGKTQTDLANLAWVSEALGTDEVATYGRYLTTRAYQFSADVVSTGQYGRGMHRDLYVIETADGDTPRVVYRRDLSRLGWPLGAALREELRQATQQ